MDDWIETELKLGLPDAGAWERIRALLGPGSIVEQTNHFFADAAGRLRAARIGVRLRGEKILSSASASASGESFYLTVKGREAAREGGPATGRSEPPDLLTRRIELESELDPAAFHGMLRAGLELRPWIVTWRRAEGSRGNPSIASFLDALEAAAGTAPLRRWGGFVNRRERLRLELEDNEGTIRIELELDRTELPGGRVDYEIEVEKTDETDPDLARTRRALLAWLRRELAIVPFAVPSKLARLEALHGEPLRDLDPASEA